MERDYREFYWKRLDNAAKGFSAISNANNTNVYRISVLLRLPVEPDALQEAVERTLRDLPSFAVKQRKGMFWYYLESNFARPPVTQEKTYPCLRIERGAGRGFLFRVTYFGCKINLEVFHSLTDGTGAIVFLERLLYNYLSLRFPERTFTECGFFDQDDHPLEYEEDSFLKNYSTAQRKESHTAAPACRVTGVALEKKVTRVVTGIFSVREVRAAAKAAGATVTQFLSAALIQAIHRGGGARTDRRRPIVICIPVNLRTFYDSHTLSNFFSYLNIGVLFERDYSFEEILEKVRREFDEELRREKIEQKLRYNVEAERNLALRFLPLGVKSLGLRIIHRRGERGQSCALSNLGVVRLPEDIAEFVERFDVLMSTSRIKPVKVGAVSFGDRLTVSFTSAVYDTAVEQYFFSFLSSHGLEVEIVHNEV